MPVAISETGAVLDGICGIAETETLLSWLQSHPQGPVDVTRCEHAHTAILQVLLAVGPTVVGIDADADADTWRSLLRHAKTDQGA
jgi:hypothetical protein